MLEVKDGNVGRLGLLFERYKKPLFGFFYNLSRNEEVSEDCVQNVFYRIMKYRYLFRGDGDFRTWMFHIARNVYLDQFRKKRIHIDGNTEALENREAYADNTVADIQRNEDLTLLSMAMSRLSEDKREILLLCKYQEKKYKEIAEILNCTEGAVKVKVFRALKELKEVYLSLDK